MNCIIVHGCPSDSSEENDKTYAKHWMPWVKDNLSKKGIKTEIALMPEPWHPDYARYKKAFEKFRVDENSILIGHSCGTSFLVHWLGDTKRKINKLILVAPWKINDHGKADVWREKFYSFSIDETIKERVKEIIIFTSDNEDPIGKKSLEIFHKALGGKIIEVKNHGHFTLEDMGTQEFPELLEVI